MKKGCLCIISTLPRLLLTLNCSHIIPSFPLSSHTHTPADSGSRHQSMMERGTSLAGEDRGEGGWNHLDAAVERELLCLSGRGEHGWKERGRQEGRRRGWTGAREGNNEEGMKSQHVQVRWWVAVKQEAKKKKQTRGWQKLKRNGRWQNCTDFLKTVQLSRVVATSW